KGAGLAGVRGLLVEMIETDVADAPLVESALGALATAVVVDTFDDAERAARLLDERKLGRCTFLPLDGVAPAREAGAEGLSRRVRCSDAMRPVVDALLGESVAVENVAVARARRADARQAGDVRLRVVTSDGAVLDAVGALTAGGGAGGAGILQRRGEL